MMCLSSKDRQTFVITEEMNRYTLFEFPCLAGQVL